MSCLDVESLGMLLHVPIHGGGVGCFATTCTLWFCDPNGGRTDHEVEGGEGKLKMSALQRGQIGEWGVGPINSLFFLSSHSFTSLLLPPCFLLLSPPMARTSATPLPSWKDTPTMGMNKKQLLNNANAKEARIVYLHRKNSKCCHRHLPLHPDDY